MKLTVCRRYQLTSEEEGLGTGGRRLEGEMPSTAGASVPHSDDATGAPGFDGVATLTVSPRYQSAAPNSQSPAPSPQPLRLREERP